MPNVPLPDYPVARDAPPHEAGATRCRALLACGNADTSAHVAELLAEYAEVDTAANGRDAMRALDANTYDLLVTDVVASSMDGFDVVEHVRASPRLRLLPVIVLSDRATEDARVGTLDARADGYLIVPLVARDLVASVVNALAKARARTDAALEEAERRVVEQTTALRNAEAERHDMLGRLVDAEEAERRRLSLELHDELGQHLTAFALGAADVRRQLDAPHSAAARLAQLEDLASLMTRDARYLALELRPPELDDVGLGSALETYVHQWRARYGVEAEFEVLGDRDDRSVPVDVSTAVYRIAQEALTNVAKHAGARHVTVLLDRGGPHLRLVVEDDGRGFEYDAAARQAKRDRRLGLAGMQERGALVGGRLQIETGAGRGTTIYLDVPV